VVLEIFVSVFSSVMRALGMVAWVVSVTVPERTEIPGVSGS
jgi:hypothetical protein